jgi:hypothetical protein
LGQFEDYRMRSFGPRQGEVAQMRLIYPPPPGKAIVSGEGHAVDGFGRNPGLLVSNLVRNYCMAFSGHWWSE